MFLVSLGLAFLLLGGVLLVIFLLYQQEYKNIRPMIVIGEEDFKKFLKRKKRVSQGSFIDFRGLAKSALHLHFVVRPDYVAIERVKYHLLIK